MCVCVCVCHCSCCVRRSPFLVSLFWFVCLVGWLVVCLFVIVVVATLGITKGSSGLLISCVPCLKPSKQPRPCECQGTVQKQCNRTFLTRAMRGTFLVQVDAMSLPLRTSKTIGKQELVKETLSVGRKKTYDLTSTSQEVLVEEAFEYKKTKKIIKPPEVLEVLFSTAKNTNSRVAIPKEAQTHCLLWTR